MKTLDRFVLIVSALLLLEQHDSFAARDVAFDSLWSAANSNELDTTSSDALFILVQDYWTLSQDSVAKHLPLIQSRRDTYHERGDELSTMRMEHALGLCYKHLHKPTQSIQHLFSALTLAGKLGLSERVALINMEIGLIYYLQATWDRSIDFFRESMRYYKSADDTARVTVRMYLIGLAMNNLGRYNESLPIFRSMYSKYERDGNSARLLEAGTGLANALRGLSKVDSAELVYLKLLAIAGEIGDSRPAFYATVYAGLAQVYYDVGRKLESETNALMALEYSNPFDYFLPRLEAQRILYFIYRERGDHERALRYLEAFTHDHDSLQNSENLSKMSVSQALYEYRRREDALIQKEASKRQAVILIAVMTSLIVVVIFFFYRSLAKQKKTTDALLENILPKDAIAELKRQGVVTPRTHHNVTIMFCDAKDFTVVAEQLSPDLLVSLLDLYFRKFDEIVTAHGLEKIKTIGDAYMAAGGLHDQSRNYAEQCVLAALEMLRFIDDVAPDLQAKHGHAFEFRIGMHTGSVVSGIVGRDKYAFDIWGDAVNTASRIEQASEVGMINLSGSTFDQIRHAFSCTHRGGISVKNKGKVEMYFLENTPQVP